MKTESEILEESQKDLNVVVEKENSLKELILDHVGTSLGMEENSDITVDMCVKVLAKDFPELMIPIVEQNFLLGYKQGLADSRSLESAVHSIEKEKKDE